LHKARNLLMEIHKGWDRDLRVDWQLTAIRYLARLAVRAKLKDDAADQLVVGAARRIGVRVDRARTIAREALDKAHAAAPPPPPAPRSAPPANRLISAAGRPDEIPVNAGRWATALGKGIDGRLRRNLLSQQIELDGEALDAESEELLFVSAQQGGWNISKPDCYDGTRAVALKHAYHPVREYLDRIAADDSIQPVDLDGLAATHIDVHDDLSAAMLRCLLIGAVARVHEPGCVAPAVLVLRGDQGIGKSDFWKALGGPFYVVSRPEDGAKDMAMAMHSSWIYDLDELDKVTTERQAAGLRSLITTDTDTLRLPYARHNQPFKRQFVIVGAVNGDGFLTDPEGNRRYWVIDCPQKKDSGRFVDGPGAKRDRDAIWKAAVLAYRSGAAWELTPAEQAASNRRNGQWEAVDEWEAPIVHWAETTITPGGFSTREAIDGAGLRKVESIQRADEMRAAQVLRRAGFRCDRTLKTRPDGVRGRFWTVTREQPEQPRTTSAGEVVHRQIAGQGRDLPPTEQPEQPFSGKTQQKERERGEREGGDDLQCSSLEKNSAVEVVQVVQSTPDRLQRNASGGEQPPEQPREVVHRQPITVDGEPGWQLPGVMPRGDGPTVRVLVIDPAGQSRNVERNRIQQQAAA
jgi:predicted P-loop ATPase